MEDKFNQTNQFQMNSEDDIKSLADATDIFRNLTENSREQSKVIKAALKNIRESVSEIKKSTQEVLERFEKIDSSANAVE